MTRPITEEISNAKKGAKDAFIDHTISDQLGYFINMEPLTSIFGPKIGPDFHRWIQRMKMIFDPKDIMNPDKLVIMNNDK